MYIRLITICKLTQLCRLAQNVLVSVSVVYSVHTHFSSKYTAARFSKQQNVYSFWLHGVYSRLKTLIVGLQSFQMNDEVSKHFINYVSGNLDSVDDNIKESECNPEKDISDDIDISLLLNGLIITSVPQDLFTNQLIVVSSFLHKFVLQSYCCYHLYTCL